MPTLLRHQARGDGVEAQIFRCQTETEGICNPTVSGKGAA